MADLTNILLSIVIGTLAALVYALRTLVIMDRKISKMMKHMGIRDEGSL